VFDILPPYSSDIVLSMNRIRDAAVFHAVTRRSGRRLSTRLIFARRVRRRGPRSPAVEFIDVDPMTDGA